MSQSGARGALTFNFWKRILVVMIAVLSVTFPAHAQDYRLGPDDVLSVVVFDQPEMSAEAVTVNSAGKIYLPASGTFSVSGKTISQVRAEITRRLGASWLKNPMVTVALRQARLKPVFVIGAVNKPGTLDYKAGWRVADAIAAAGGLMGRVEETSATLRRGNRPPLTIALSKALNAPESAANRVLQPSDELTLTALPPAQITVSGDVLRPASYELRHARRLQDALVAAGGLKQRVQNTRGFLIRNGQRIELDLDAANDYANYKANLALLPSDFITIEAIQPVKVSVTSFDGLVKVPGNYEIERGAGVLQAVLQAGGLRDGVTSDQVVVSVQRDGKNLPVNLNDAVLDSRANLPLLDRDNIFLTSPKSISVRVSGLVRNPQLLKLKPGTHLREAISQAGGLTLTPEQASIRILRDAAGGKQTILNVDAKALIGLKDLRQDAELKEGDLVSVNAIERKSVAISGEVLTQGLYDLKEGDTVADLVLRAGGATPGAALTNVTVTRRDGTSTKLDLFEVLHNGGQKVDYPLQDGDLVVVGRITKKVLVMEAVNRPGYIPIPEKGVLTLNDALVYAGGPRERAKLKEVAILRRTPTGVQRRIVSLADIPKGSSNGDLNLQDGDVVYVPQGYVNPGVLSRVFSVLPLFSYYQQFAR